DEPANQAHVPKRNRYLALGFLFRGNPLDHPASKKESLAEKSNAEPDRFEAHNGTVMRDGQDGRKMLGVPGGRFSQPLKSRLSRIFLTSRLPARHLPRNVYRSTLVCIHRTAIKS